MWEGLPGHLTRYLHWLWETSTVTHGSSLRDSALILPLAPGLRVDGSPTQLFCPQTTWSATCTACNTSKWAVTTHFHRLGLINLQSPDCRSLGHGLKTKWKSAHIKSFIFFLIPIKSCYCVAITAGLSTTHRHNDLRFQPRSNQRESYCSFTSCVTLATPLETIANSHYVVITALLPTAATAKI